MEIKVTTELNVLFTRDSQLDNFNLRSALLDGVEFIHDIHRLPYDTLIKIHDKLYDDNNQHLIDVEFDYDIEINEFGEMVSVELGGIDIIHRLTDDFLEVLEEAVKADALENKIDKSIQDHESKMRI